MAERKVINKYYPPNFDPSKLERRKRSRGDTVVKLQTVRLMAPFSMKCTACGEYIYKGKKFNARKESTGEKYLGIQVLRFHIRCTRCSAEITFKTDPKNSDYVSERGAVRNFEPWRGAEDKEETEEERLDRLEREEQDNDAMAELEVKVLDAKREMEIADALDELRSRNALTERVNPEASLDVIHSATESKIAEEKARQEEEDDRLAKEAFIAAKIAASAAAVSPPPVPTVAPTKPTTTPSNPLDLLKRRREARSSLGILLKKPKIA
ncbi:uncharacterized protein V1518DRAFT_409934 [Limtongia smithiae]|uniref:uncharacterized protein n=1 Tax=Limtongia smithiae TaxID=1125753 RepID=UPI0034CD1F62